MAASFRVTLIWDGKRSGRQRRPMQADSRREAAYYTLQWVVWSHLPERNKKFHRYSAFVLEEFDGETWNVVKEGTYEDATAEYIEKDTGPPAIGAIKPVQIGGRKERPAPRIRQAPRRRGGNDRLAALVNKVLRGG